MSATVTQVTPRATLVRANNPSMMTLEGTNSWVLREPGGASVVVVDPGPLDEQHLETILETANRDGGRVELVLYTHWHHDHTESIERFAELTGAPARAIDAAWCRGAEPLRDDELIELGGISLRVLSTPGHTVDSMCLLLPAESTLLTGDTVLGEGTTVVAHPDGALAPYLNSLHRLRDLTAGGGVHRILPGHGPVVTDPQGVLEYYLSHREDRLQQVRAALAAGDTTARQVVERVYRDVDRRLWSAAEWSVQAQLDYLNGDRGPAR